MVLVMMVNIYQTEAGIYYASKKDHSEEIINFCIFSLDSIDEKIVLSAIIILYNHVMTYQGDFEPMNDFLLKAIIRIVELLPTYGHRLVNKHTVMVTLLAEARMLY